MATLERRVQVLFGREQYARIESDARMHGMSVGAFIRDTMQQREDREGAERAAALERLWEWADANPGPTYTPEEWEVEKEALLDRPSLRDIP